MTGAPIAAVTTGHRADVQVRRPRGRVAGGVDDALTWLIWRLRPHYAVACDDPRTWSGPEEGWSAECFTCPGRVGPVRYCYDQVWQDADQHSRLTTGGPTT